MSRQTSVAPVMWHRKIGKVSKPFKLNIGLLCSKSFDDALFDELFEVKYGLKRENIAKMNIKGVFQVWTKDGGYHEINLKECHAWTREGCNHCPDFGRARRHLHRRDRQRDRLDPHHRANWELGRAVIDAMVKDGAIETRPGDDDPGAIALMHRLAENSCKRWPDWAQPAAKVGISAKPAG